MAEAVVYVKQGKLKGKTGIDYAGRSFYSFQGIPYAKPPLGELRFKVGENTKCTSNSYYLPLGGIIRILSQRKLGMVSEMQPEKAIFATSLMY